MLFDFLSSAVDQFDRLIRTEITRAIEALRADIESCDEQFAFYEADIIESDRQSAQLSAQIQMLQQHAKDLSNVTAKIEDRASKYGRMLAKYEKETNDCLDDMEAVKKSIKNIHASIDEPQRIRLQAHNARVNEFRKAVKRRKELTQETGHEHCHENYSENQLAMARARLAELEAKKDAPKAPSNVKVEERKESDRKTTKHRSKKSKHKSKESSHSKRSSRKSN